MLPMLYNVGMVYCVRCETRKRENDNIHTTFRVKWVLYRVVFFTLCIFLAQAFCPVICLQILMILRGFGLAVCVMNERLRYFRHKHIALNSKHTHTHTHTHTRTESYARIAVWTRLLTDGFNILSQSQIRLAEYCSYFADIDAEWISGSCGLGLIPQQWSAVYLLHSAFCVLPVPDIVI